MGVRVLWLVVVACVTACGGGESTGGGPGAIPGPGFEVASSNPVPGGIDVSVDAPITVFFNLPANLASVDGTTFRVETTTGVAVLSVVQRINDVQVRLVPNAPLFQNTAYRVVMSGDVRSASGERLGTDYVFTFVTDATGPTLRPDQIVDLGDQLLQGRFRARSLSINGVITVFGGYIDEQTVTDTVEIYDETTGMFRFANANMLEPRAEHTVSVMRDGRVLITGGIGMPGGPPLATTEYYDPTAETFTPGPPMLEARRWHAASTLFGAEHLLVSGGFGASGTALGSVERLVNGVWIPMGDLLVPNAQHVQVNMGLDVTYIGVGNEQGIAAIFDGTGLSPHTEGVRRSRDAAVRLDDGRLMMASGDVRTVTIFDAQVGASYFASELFFERRGEHTLASIGPDMFLAVGGFNINLPGEPALDSCEIVEYLPGPVPDARVHYLFSPRLPVPFAGHVSEKLLDGSILLMGGVGPAGQPHSRRVVQILVD